MTLEEQVQQVIAEALGVEASVITLDLGINDIPEWNSMGNMAIIAAMEEKFEVEIPLEDLFELTSVQGIIEEIKKIKQ